MIPVPEVISEVRRGIDEFTLNNEAIAFDADMEDTASSNFSDEDIADRILDVTRAIAARVKSAHLTDPATTYANANRNGLIQLINPTVGAALTPPGNSSDTNYPFSRLLTSRVFLDSASAARRGMNAHAASSGLEPTVAKPVFVYSDHEFIMATANDSESSSAGSDPWTGGAGDPGTAKAYVVMVPMFVQTSTSIGDIPAMQAVGDRWLTSGSWSAANLGIPLDDKFKRPIINGVLSSCFITIREPQVAVAYRARMMSGLKAFLHQRYLAEEVPDLKNM